MKKGRELAEGVAGKNEPEKKSQKCFFFFFLTLGA